MQVALEVGCGAHGFEIRTGKFIDVLCPNDGPRLEFEPDVNPSSVREWSPATQSTMSRSEHLRRITSEERQRFDISNDSKLVLVE